MRGDMIKHEFTAQSEEWLEFRRKNLTGTEVSCLFKGMGFKSASAIMQEKLNPPEKFDNRFMHIGRILEPAVLNAFQLNLGINALPASAGDKVTVLAHHTLPLSCTLDGVTPEGHVVEAKTAGGLTIERATANVTRWIYNVPYNYALQVHTQMILAEADTGYIGVLGYYYPVPFIAYRVQRNKFVEACILRAVDLFWDAFHNDKIYEIPAGIPTRLREALDSSAELIYNDL
jgi:predicted phage-related endonuclease